MEVNRSIIFGPVPSRRLGRSVGLNNIPPKICTYSCAYCQLGRTTDMRTKRQAFYDPLEILASVQRKLTEAADAGEGIDYLTFVSDGEPTLDINLGREMALLRPLGVPLAIITNASLIWRKDVREALMEADWVSLKFDAVEEKVWRKVDRPHGSLDISAIREGALAFASVFKGKLVTETMLLAGVNDGEKVLQGTADFVASLHPDTAYLSIPIRPPAEGWAQQPDEHAINRAYQVFRDRLPKVEYLTGYEGSTFAFTGDAEGDILSITSVHPMRDDAIDEFLERAGAKWETIHRMVQNGQLIETEYRDNKYYLRRFSKGKKGTT